MSFSIGWYSVFVFLLTIKASIERSFQAAYHILSCSTLIFFNSNHYTISKTLKLILPLIRSHLHVSSRTTRLIIQLYLLL